MSSGSGRIEIFLENPNELFVSWVEKWLNDAKRRNSKSQNTLKVALEALKSFPLPLATGRECAILRGFGKSLCTQIDQKLDEYKRTNSEEYNRSINYTKNLEIVTKSCSKKNSIPKSPKKKYKSRQDALKGGNATDKEDKVVMDPGEFDIILLVDTQETNGKLKKSIDDTRLHLESFKTPYEVRRLGVGDFLWLARNSKNQELVLPYVVERKRMDDFASSIRDGRFHEQKHRLRESSIPNLIYLIESHGSNQHIGLPMPTLMQAATNTQIHSKFQIKFTDSIKDSMMYLSVLTNILTQQFKQKHLISCAKSELNLYNPCQTTVELLKFNEFQLTSSKNRNVHVKEIFIKQLLQLKSLSVDKALAIVNVYPTPKTLILAYKNCASLMEAENLLTSIKSGPLNRPVGSYISKVIYQFYNTEFGQ